MADLTLEQGLSVLESRTKWVGILIGTFVASSLALVAGQIAEIAGRVDLEAEEGDFVAQMVVSLVYLSYAAIFVATVVLVAMWIYRAHANVRSAGIALEVSPRWAVGWFFVPIANLFKPFQAMRELWNASHNLSDGYSQESPPLLKLWWGFWIVSNIITNISTRAMFTGEPGATDINPLDVVGGLLLIPTAWFLWRIVKQVNSVQRSTLAAASTFS